MGKLIDADHVKAFFFSETSGTEDVIRDLMDTHGLDYANDINEEVIMAFAKDLLKAVQSVIDTEPTACDPDKIVEQLENERKFWENVYNRNLGKEKARSYEHAIEIVKGGGTDETTEQTNKSTERNYIKQQPGTGSLDGSIREPGHIGNC